MSSISVFTKNIITTTKDLNGLISDVNEAEASSFGSEAKLLSTFLKGKVSTPFQEALEKLEKEKEVPINSDERASYFSELKQKLQSLPKVEVELAFTPSDAFTKKIARFIREATGEPVVLDIKDRPSVLAGLTISYNGQFKDYSFSSRLDEVLKQKHSKGFYENV